MKKIYTLANHLYARSGIAGNLSNLDDKRRKEFTDVIEEKTPAEILSDSLRLGIMDEWGWKVLDELEDSLGKPISRFQLSGYFPYMVVNLDETKELIVLGPQGIVQRYVKPDNFTKDLTMAYINGDLLYQTGREDKFQYYWLSKPDTPVKLYFYNKDGIGITTPKGGVCNGYATTTPGAGRIKAKKEFSNIFSDGNNFWIPCERFDPDTGKTIKEKDLPEWFLEKMQEADIAEQVTKYSDYYPIENGLEKSPLGIKNNQYGLRLWRKDNATVIIEDTAANITEWDVPKNNLAYRALPCGFFKFPERQSIALILRDYKTTGVIDQLTSSVILPVGTRDRHDDLWLRSFEQVHWWHFLSPRDPAGSKALANCSLDQAEKLLQATLNFAGNMKLNEFLKLDDFCLQEIKQILPEVTHPQLIRGISKTLQAAVVYINDCKSIQKEDADKEASKKIIHPYNVSASECQDSSASVLSYVFQNNIRFTNIDQDYGASLKSAEFFFNDNQAKPGLHVITQSHIGWIFLSLYSNTVLWFLLMSGLPKEEKQKIAQALLLWTDTDIAKNPQHYRVMEANIKGIKDADSKKYISGFCENEHHYLLFQHTFSWSSEKQDYLILEKSVEGVFKDPANSTISWSIKCDSYSLPAEKIKQAVKYFLEHGSVDLNIEATNHLSQELGVTYTTAAIFYTGSIFQEKTDSAFLRKIKVKREEEEIGYQEINKRFDKDQNIVPEKNMLWNDLLGLYSSIMPADPLSLYSPLDEKDGSSAINHLITTWKEWSGERRILDVDLMERLKKDFQDPNGLYYYDTRILENASTYTGLLVDEKWIIKPYEKFVSKHSWRAGYIPEGWPKFLTLPSGSEQVPIHEVFTGVIFERFVRLISWAYLEMPIFFPQKQSLIQSIQLINDRLNNPELLFLAGALNLIAEEEKDVSEEFNNLIAPFIAKPYANQNGEQTAEGYDRGDLVVTWPEDGKNGLFISFRPAFLKEPQQLEQLAKEMGVYDIFKKGRSFCACGLNFGRNHVSHISILPHYLLWRSEGFEKLLTIYKNDSRKIEGYYANPKLTAPELVDKCMKELKLSEYAAIYFLQILSLPDPSPERVMRYNNWDQSTLENAEKELLDNKLVVAKEIIRSKRRVFIKAGIDSPSPPAIPLEPYKTELYGLEYDKKGRPDVPYKMILPQRPLEDIFHDAWQWYQSNEKIKIK